MTSPKLSCICVTGGRVHLLQEAIACFLEQQCEWPRELVILNTLPAQHLSLPNAASLNVGIVNLSQRPPSLGAARNFAIGIASGTHIVNWDDDDAYAPQFLQTFVDAYQANPPAEWVWQDRQFYSLGGKIQKIVQGTCNTLSFTKAAWEKSGKYPALNVGEDRALMNAVTTALPGVRQHVEDAKIGFIYCWGNGVYHISGMGDDRQKRKSAWERSEMTLHNQLRSGHIPAGKIVLAPGCKKRPAEKIAAFFGANASTEGLLPGIGVVLLGRYGDIINALPILKRLHDDGRNPHLIVSREFANLLEGVSYVKAHPVDIPFDNLIEAVEYARRRFSEVLRLQIYGRGHAQTRLTESYNMEAWREAGFLERFHDLQLPLVFDRRNNARESAVVRKLFRTEKPKIVTSLTSGVTSPFAGGQAVLRELRSVFGDTHEIVEIGNLKLKRVYDLLGAMEKASLIIATDTAPLHLAAAVATPLIALVNPAPWMGSAIRFNCFRRIPYPEGSPANLTAVVREALSSKRPKIPAAAPISAPVAPVVRIQGDVRCFHLVERHEEPRNRRKESAWATWDVLYSHGVLPRHFWFYPRSARDLGDRRALPFLKDVLAFGMADAGAQDVLMLTNDDVALHSALAQDLPDHVSQYGACCAQRREFKRAMPSAAQSPAEIGRQGERHMGRDLFAFSREWLETHWDAIPDFVLGASEWDLALAALIRSEHGIATTPKNIWEAIFPCELAPGYVWHQYHPPVWMNAGNVNSAPSQIHNRKLAAPLLPGWKLGL